MLCKVMTVLFIDYPCTNILDIFVRFDPTSYTTTEAEGSVTVSVHIDEGLSKPFTVLLLPGEGNVVISNVRTWHCTFFIYAGFQKSEHYVLECDIRLHFNSSIRMHSYTYHIIPDDTCDFQFGEERKKGIDFFEIYLHPYYGHHSVAIDLRSARATIFIDDSQEDECCECIFCKI